MKNMIDLDSYKNIAFKIADELGFSEYEIYFEIEEIKSVQIQEIQLSNYSYSKFIGVAFRGIYKGFIGKSFSEDLTMSGITKLIKQAKENAMLLKIEDCQLCLDANNNYVNKNNYHEVFDDISMSQIIETLCELEITAKKYSKAIADIKITYNYSTIIVQMTNSFGLSKRIEENYINVVVDAKAQKEQNSKILTKKLYLKELNKEKLFDFILEVSKDVCLSLESQLLDKGYYKVIIQNNVFNELLSHYSQSFNALQVYNKTSIFSENYNQVIASTLVTLKDVVEHSLSHKVFLFDYEGNQCVDKTIIENGVLKQLLYTSKSAALMNKSSNSNGFRENYKSNIKAMFTNCYIKQGDISYDSLVKRMYSGVIVTKIHGFAGANVLTGNFSLSIDGYFYKNGSFEFAVEQHIIVGNFVQVLKDIEAIGKDLLFTSNYEKSVYGSPSLLIKQLYFCGKE